MLLVHGWLAAVAVAPVTKPQARSLVNLAVASCKSFAYRLHGKDLEGADGARLQVDPNDIRLETREDGTLRVLGSGTYGKVRPADGLAWTGAPVAGPLQRTLIRTLCMLHPSFARFSSGQCPARIDACQLISRMLFWRQPHTQG